MAEIVVMQLSGVGRDGSLIEFADESAAQKAIDQFGHALGVERIAGESGTTWLVACAEQRGPRGAYRLHSIACDRRIPVSVR